MIREIAKVGTSGGQAFVEINTRAVSGKIRFPVNALGPIKYNQRAEVTIRLIETSAEEDEKTNVKTTTR